MQGEKAQKIPLSKGSVKFELPYELTSEQSNISNKVLASFKKRKNVLIHAVCGAGKTEIVFETIKYAIENGLQVGFAIPRREVVQEIYSRLKRAFPLNNVIAVYGGNTSVLTGDIIVLTTHQIYRYPSYFDLLILDEIDAFPFKDDELLYNMFVRSVKGNYVMMSATPDANIIKQLRENECEIFELKTRFHHMPIPEPSMMFVIGFLKYFVLLKKLKKFIANAKKVIIFVPTIEKSISVFRIVSRFISGGNYVNSKVKNSSHIINEFKANKYSYLVSTSILERGITIKSLQVIVVDADDAIFDEYSLIQIAGRVGRSKDETYGEVIFLANKENDAMRNALATIKECNEHLQSVF
ncbi:MAG: DEAD/DEAH box helicase [Bacilli bacterium]